jgi:hypothetical protein
VDRACGTRERRENVYKVLVGKTEGDGGVDWKMGSELILGRLAGGIEWIQLAQDRDRWRASGSGIAELGGRNRGMTVEFSIYTVSYAE